MNTFFTADLHLGHKAIAEHFLRPFETVKEMDATIINNWNKTIKRTDRVYVLGDFAWHNVGGYLRRLNGQIHLIEGNHDKLNQKEKKLFASYAQIRNIKNPMQKGRIVLCHYAMRSWYGSYKGYWHLYGHSHGKLEQLPNRSMDVGVDTNNFYPYEIEEISNILTQNILIDTI